MSHFQPTRDSLSSVLGADNVTRAPGEMAACLTDWTRRFQGRARRTDGAMLTAMRKIKSGRDPSNIMNPGKVP